MDSIKEPQGNGENVSFFSLYLVKGIIGIYFERFSMKIYFKILREEIFLRIKIKSMFFAQVYLVGHIPPGVDERQGGDLPPSQYAYQARFNRKYLHLVKKYSDTIVGQFFGHLHSDSFRIVYNDVGE